MVWWHKRAGLIPDQKRTSQQLVHVFGGRREGLVLPDRSGHFGVGELLPNNIKLKPKKHFLVEIKNSLPVQLDYVFQFPMERTFFNKTLDCHIYTLKSNLCARAQP